MCVIYIYIYIYFIFIKIENNIETFFICFEQLRFPIICWDFPNEESKVRFEWLLWLKMAGHLVAVDLILRMWKYKRVIWVSNEWWFIGAGEWFSSFLKSVQTFLTLCFVLLVCVDSVDSCYGKAAAVTAQIHSCETLPMALQSSFSSFIRLFVRTRYCTFSQIKVYVVAKRNHCDWFIWIVS